MDKTITVREKTWRKLTTMKINLGCQTLDEALDKLFQLVTKFKLAKELEDLK